MRRGLTNRLSHGLGLILVCLLGACGEGPKSDARPGSAGAAGTRPPLGVAQPDSKTRGVNYSSELAKLSSAIDGAVKSIAAQPDNTLLALETVSLYVERARLSGDYDDYRAAEALLKATSARVPKLSFPCIEQAKLEYALHRLPAASAALDACPIAVAQDEVAGLRGDIAFYSGRYQDAEAIYRELVNRFGTPQQYLRLALLRSRMGSPGEAAAFLEAAEKRYYGVSATMKAWLKLQRGLLAFDRGRLDEAIALYLLASDELPGWWMIDEHIADARRLKADAAGAKALYEDVVRRTGLPEHMDELARLLREGDAPEAANEWIKRAESAYRERLKILPEASAGHAVEHFLQFGTPDEALALARRAAELRPFGEAQIALAAALFRAGRVGEAAALIARVQQSGWDTPQLHAVAATIYASLGRTADADAARAAALRMNRHAMRAYPVVTPVQPELISML